MTLLNPHRFGTGHQVNAVNFDGATRLSRGGQLTGIANSKSFTFSVWVKLDSDGANDCILYGYHAFGNLIFYVYKLATNRIQIYGKNGSGTEILNVLTPADSINAADGWVNVLASIDLNNTANRHIYIDDQVQTLTVNTYVNDSIVFQVSNPGFKVGANGTDADHFNGDMAELWFMPGTFIDLSVQANRRDFISANQQPVDLGADGSEPTGGAPMLFLSGATASWHLNKGAGGGMTRTGLLTDASSHPSD